MFDYQPSSADTLRARSQSIQREWAPPASAETGAAAADRAASSLTHRGARGASMQPADTEEGTMFRDMPLPGAEVPQPSMWKQLEGDYGNVAILLVLYLLQGLPMGLAATAPLILKEKNVSLSDIGTLASSSLPFAVKLLWAPVVDSCFVRSMGRRKTWVVPLQLLIGATLIAAPIDELIEQKAIWPLTRVFATLYFLCATQDVAVDGWALTMLSKKNVGYASLCNSAGQTLGFFLSFTGFLALQKYDVCTLNQWCKACGTLFIVFTLLIWAFKHEKVDDHVEHVADTYRNLWKILHVVPVRKLIIVLLTCKLPFCVSSLAGLRLQEYGIPKEDLAFLQAGCIPIAVVAPIFLARRLNSERPLSLMVDTYLPRIALSLPVVVLVKHAYALQGGLGGGELGPAFYAGIVVIMVLENIAMSAMFSSQMALFARVSDERIGGTYMTFLNTVCNMGGQAVNIIAPKAVDLLTTPEVDGFYSVAAIASAYGVVWYTLRGRSLMNLIDATPLSDWLTSKPAE